jgi:cellulose synthase/poly-beta-1,6-N-acetylglucosamine synthase-like glycosyltransferase
MYELIRILNFLIENGIFLIAVIIFATYILMAVISGFEMISYLRKNSFVDYSALLSSPLAPSITIIAPAYNEGNTIIDNIRSLLSIHYTDFEIVIINDGSTDDSLSKVIGYYQLERVDYLIDATIPTKPIRGIYKSSNRAYSKLTVIDKVNGGKADSLNTGINFSSNRYFAAIDVDCILNEDAILKMIKPFLEDNRYRVIAAGGVIRVANSCKVKDGKIVEINLPRSILARFQVLEYTRSFLMGRMAWSRLNGLLLISGAFGIFDREIVLKAGGYDIHTVGEDMELIVRMRRYMIENKLSYRVIYIPDPLCWTVVPESLKILSRQRNRWTRGTMETLFKHITLFYNPKYGNLGMIGHPYWFFFEWLAPIIEFLGIFYFLLVLVLGNPDWPFFYLLLGFTYLFAVVYSSLAVVFEEFTFAIYRRKRDVLKLILISLIEPLIFHPLTIWFSLKGNYHYLIGNISWGKMEKRGFGGKKKNN